MSELNPATSYRDEIPSLDPNVRVYTAGSKPAVLTEVSIDHKPNRGCARCHVETRAYKSIGNKDFCEPCYELVRELELLHEAFRSLTGSGEP